MPKVKTNRGAAKRFRLTAKGRIKRNKAYRRHILSKKSTSRKRDLRGPAVVHQNDRRSVLRLLLGC